MTGIKDRCYQFSLSVIRYLRSKEWDRLNMVMVNQLMRSATSVGANVSEAGSSSTRLEFRRYYVIALKSANESMYWMNLIKDANDWQEDEKLLKLLQECNEICRLLASSIKKLKEAKV
jgi:four helix bundle protein